MRKRLKDVIDMKTGSSNEMIRWFLTTNIKESVWWNFIHRFRRKNCNINYTNYADEIRLSCCCQLVVKVGVVLLVGRDKYVSVYKNLVGSLHLRSFIVEYVANSCNGHINPCLIYKLIVVIPYKQYQNISQNVLTMFLLSASARLRAPLSPIWFWWRCKVFKLLTTEMNRCRFLPSLIHPSLSSLSSTSWTIVHHYQSFNYCIGKAQHICQCMNQLLSICKTFRPCVNTIIRYQRMMANSPLEFREVYRFRTMLMLALSYSTT